MNQRVKFAQQENIVSHDSVTWRFRTALLFFALSFYFASSSSAQNASTPQKPLFARVASAESGITFRNQLRDNRQMNVLMYHYYHNGGGVSLGDINNDGLDDIYLSGNLVPNRLYLNRGGMRFEDISKKAGVLGRQAWATGTTMADVNADGYLDIYVSYSGAFDAAKRRNQLFINNGDLTFTESAKEFGLDDPSYSTQAAFFDYDGDGDLDMYLLNHSVLEGQNRSLTELTTKRDPYVGDKLYRNDAGKFIDVSESAGIIGNAIGYGLGVSVGDLNDDGWPDVYVANDFLERDYLYINKGDGTFQEQLKDSLKQLSNFSMGTDIADFDNDGRLDIFVADMAAEDNYRIKANMSGMAPEKFWKAVEAGFHYQYMINTLQRNNGNGSFSQISQLAGVSNTDWSWAPLFADFDNDGFKDLLVTNGLRKETRNNDFVKIKKEYAPTIQSGTAEEQDKALQTLLAKMPAEKLHNYIYHNNGDLSFSEKSSDWGLSEKTFSNGAAFSDLDGDGDLDLVISNVDDEAYLYRNHAAQRTKSDFIRLALKGSEQNPFGIGARISIEAGGRTQILEQHPTRGFQSSVSNTLHAGLGDAKTIDRLTVIWPDGKQEIRRDLTVNTLLTLNHADATTQPRAKLQKQNQLFRDVTSEYKLKHRHIENDYDDFAREVLLPHKRSQFGPALAVGDVNGDTLDDFYIGGAKGHPGTLYIQTSARSFNASAYGPWIKDANSEDVGATFFDADDDGDLDLYVTSGGSEHEENDALLQDRLYTNNGKGVFATATKVLPPMLTSSSVVVAADYDGDGDKDLFVGGQTVPGRYPFAPRSYLLRNDKGKFSDVTAQVAPALTKPGLVSSAAWIDANGDKKLDLLLSGEWMPLMLLTNTGTQLVDATNAAGLKDTRGWWFSLSPADFDGDGDIDFVAGNLGLNYKYKASAAEPFSVNAHDFDGNGTLDIVLSYYNQGTEFPLRGRECSSQQMPFITEKFENYHAFARASLTDVFAADTLNQSLRLEATTFASAYVENRGDGTFVVHTLPHEAQIETGMAILVADFNQDGSKDFLLAGNLYGAEVETPRNDAGTGALLLGNKSSKFKPQRSIDSGFLAHGNIRAIETIRLGTNKSGVIVAMNNDSLRLFAQAR